MRISRSIVIVAMAIVSMLSFGMATSFAQEATPTAEPGAAEGVIYPVAVHEGTCEMPTPEPEFTLNDTIVVSSDVAEAELIGDAPGQPALISETSAEVALADLGSAPRVLAIHQSAEEFGTLVACGSISGMLADGEMVITLQPVEQSGVSGIAIMTEEDGETNFQIYVVSPETTPATPGA